MGKLRIVLADDHAVVRAGLKALIDADPGMEVVGEAADGPAAVAVVADADPDVVVVDLSMPGLTGAELTARLVAARAGRRVLALTVHEEPGYVRQLLTAGAAGYVLKRAAAAELLRSVRAVAAGGTYLDPSVASAVVAPPAKADIKPAAAAADLSDREAEVVRLIAHGYSNKEIAARLGLSVKTVETYKARSLDKLGIRTRVELVRYATHRGWLTDV